MRKPGEGYYFKEPSTGYFCWRIRIDGSDTTRKAKTAAALKKKVKAVLDKIEAGELATKESATWALSKFLNVWLADFVKGSKSEATHRQYEQTVRNYIEPQIGKVKLRDLDIGHIQRMMNAVSVSQSRSTANLARRTLSTAITCAIGLGAIKTNPARAIKALSTVAPDPKPIHPDLLPRFNAEALRTNSKGRLIHPHGPLLVFMTQTGLRISEALGLRHGSVNRAVLKIKIVERVQFLDDGGWELAPLKSKAARRTIPLSNLAAEVLDIRGAAQTVESKRKHYEDHGFVFASLLGTPVLPRNAARSLSDILEKAGLDDYSPHCLRDTFATLMARKRTPPHVLKYLLGHSSIVTTDRHYVGIFDDDLTDAINALN